MKSKRNAFYGLLRQTVKPMIFGIHENNKGNIWFGDFGSVYRYEARLNDEVGQGKTITDFKSKVNQK